MQSWDEALHGKTIARTEEDGESRLVLHFTDGSKAEVTTCSCCGLWGGMVAGDAGRGLPQASARANAEPGVVA